MKWNEFIKKLMLDYRLSANEFAKKCNISVATISNIVKGKTSQPFPDTIRRIEEGLHIKIDDRDINNITYTKIPYKNEIDLSNITFINKNKGYPVLTRVYADSNPESIFVQENIISYLNIPYKKQERCFFVKVEGDSMPPIINDGDYAFIDMDEPIRNNDIVIVLLEDGRQLIKRYKRINETLVMLYSENNNYEPIVVNSKDIVLIYKIVSSIKYFK